MTKVTRKLLISVLTVVLTVVALGTTTFAWFTLTNTSVVQAFEADIVADSAIELAIGNHNTGLTNPTSLEWVTTLTKEDVETYIESVYGTAPLFNHVTTANAIDFFTLGATAMAGTTTGYLDIPLNFRSDTAQTIEWTSVTLTSTVAPWTADVDFIDAAGSVRTSGDSFDIDASNAMRVAVLEVYGTGDHVVVYEKPASASNVVLGTGGDLRGTLVDPDLTPASGDEYYPGINGAMNYYYEKNNTLPFGADAVTTIAADTAITGVTVITMEDVSALPTDYQATYYGQLTIRIWLEGWDANAYNAILSRIIETSFIFTGV